MRLAFVGLGFFGGIGTALGQGAGANPASAGCLGTPVQVCMEALSGQMQIREDELQRELAKLDEVDVNGKPTGQNLVTVFGRPPGFREDIMLTVDIRRPGKTVKAMSGDLLADPEVAKTEEEYDHTGIYEVMGLLLSPSCMARADFYRFFENKIKPTIRTQHRPDHYGPGSIIHDQLFSKSRPVPFCGHTLQFSSWSGYDTGDASEDNLDGVFVKSSFDVK